MRKFFDQRIVQSHLTTGKKPTGFHLYDHQNQVPQRVSWFKKIVFQQRILKRTWTVAAWLVLCTEDVVRAWWTDPRGLNNWSWNLLLSSQVECNTTPKKTNRKLLDQALLSNFKDKERTILFKGWTGADYEWAFFFFFILWMWAWLFCLLVNGSVKVGLSVLWPGQN